MQSGSMTVDTTQVDPKHARDWWGVRDLEVERELAAALQRRMEAQRAQLYAFKTEQSKWEHELQLRISKYAHDRKLLSEHNVELQENLTAMEEKLLQYQREMDMQVQHVIELEARLQATHVDAKQVRALSKKNEELQLRLRQWEKFYRDEKVVIAKEQHAQQEELLTELEWLLAISQDSLVSQQLSKFCSEKGTTESKPVQDTKRRQKGDGDDDSFVKRIKELEAMCEQKVCVQIVL
ncbi:hypothetical protein PsorP6_013019 [Peronosclerospora sorghi]|uniref:Uncharacterized protein n=1 Tax=Peronosclerospora sorghi TaxID=230839 RepID=A0ACC0WGG1_9STRA|nr:hypothetical protein PsorP6_013019 [Peronosclerospora sorghi]